MNSADSARNDLQLTEKLATSGFRFTPHRQQVYSVLLENPSHPTAEEVFIRAKRTMPDIAIATVYNCLDALVKSGLVRQVNVERTASRYCPNMKDHFHFYCEECAGIFDIDAADLSKPQEVKIPTGYRVHQYDVSFRGLCPDCNLKKS